MSETQPPPAASGADNLNLRREESRPPDTGRSLANALAEMQRRRVETPTAPAPPPMPSAFDQPPPVSQAVVPAWTPPAAPAQAPALPPPDATMEPAPASQSTGHATAGDMVVNVMVDGQLTPMTISELQAGYMRGRDYTIKAKQNAEQLRQAQQAQQQFATARALMEQRLPQFIAERGQEFAKPVDWERLSREDPIGTGQKLARFMALQQAYAEQATLQQIKDNEANQRKAELHRLGHDVLCRLIPGWADDATRRVIQNALRSHAISMGWSAEEVDRAELLDPRDLYMAWKSMNYDRLMAQRVTPQPVGAPVHANGGARQRVGEQPGLAELEERFDRTRTVDDALAIMQARARLDGRGSPAAPAPQPRPNGRYR